MNIVVSFKVFAKFFFWVIFEIHFISCLNFFRHSLNFYFSKGQNEVK